MSTSTATKIDPTELHEYVTRSGSFEPDPATMAGTPTARRSFDGRGITYTWLSRTPTEGESVPAIDLSVYWHGDLKCFHASARQVEIERDHGMTITKISNLLGDPTLQVRSNRFARYSAKNLEAFATAAVAWLQARAAL